MNPANVIPVLLLSLLGLALGGGAIVVALAFRLNRQEHGGQLRAWNQGPGLLQIPGRIRQPFVERPVSWLAIKSRDPGAVQDALALNNPTPCSWAEGLSRGEKLFISPPVNGWVLATGSGLPNPYDDVDDCFRFVVELSRRLGQVQFFKADHVSHQHSWVRAEAGRVVRAYAWAGKTLWNQGVKTADEVKLGMKCFGYSDEPDPDAWAVDELLAANVGRVPLLAARWSLDPSGIDGRQLEQAYGVVGEPRRFY